MADMLHTHLPGPWYCLLGRHACIFLHLPPGVGGATSTWWVGATPPTSSSYFTPSYGTDIVVRRAHTPPPPHPTHPTLPWVDIPDDQNMGRTTQLMTYAIHANGGTAFTLPRLWTVSLTAGWVVCTAFFFLLQGSLPGRAICYRGLPPYPHNHLWHGGVGIIPRVVSAHLACGLLTTPRCAAYLSQPCASYALICHAPFVAAGCRVSRSVLPVLIAPRHSFRHVIFRHHRWFALHMLADLPVLPRTTTDALQRHSGLPALGIHNFGIFWTLPAPHGKTPCCGWPDICAQYARATASSPHNSRGYYHTRLY